MTPSPYNHPVCTPWLYDGFVHVPNGSGKWTTDAKTKNCHDFSFLTYVQYNSLQGEFTTPPRDNVIPLTGLPVRAEFILKDKLAFNPGLLRIDATLTTTAETSAFENGQQYPNTFHAMIL